MKALLMGLSALALVSCGKPTSTAEDKDRASVAEQQEQYSISQPIPKFDWSLERDITIQLYHIRNSRVATHTIWRGDTSVVEGDCPSIGYGLPYDTSLTNPLQLFVDHKYAATYHSGVIEQPEPNGIYASKNSIATWVFCVVDGDIAPVYVEGKVTTYPYPVDVDYERNKVSRAQGSKPSVVIKQDDKG